MKGHRGYSAALILSILGGAATGNLAEMAGGAQCLCCLAGGGLGMLAFLLLGLLRRRTTGEFYPVLRGDSGPGRVLALTLSLVFLRLSAHDLAAAGEFVSANLLDHTPYLLTTGLMAAAACFGAVKGERTVGRWSAVLLPPLVGMLLLALLLALPDLRIEELKAGLDAGVGELTRGTLDLFLLPFCGSLGCGLLLFQGGREQSIRSGVLGAGIAGVLLALLYAANTALLGAKVLSNFNFPTYHALRVIGLSSLALRLESLLMLPLVMVSFLRITVLLLAAARGIEAGLGLRGKLLLPGLGAAALLLSLLCYQNQSDLLLTEERLGFLALLPLGAVLLTLLRKKTGGNG